MIPHHILTEIALRLPGANPGAIEKIAEAVGIDLPASIEPVPSIEDAAPALRSLMPWGGDVIHGAVPFEVKLTVLGQKVTQTCRAVFSTVLIDDLDCPSDQPTRIQGQTEINWQILDWRDFDRFDEVTGEHLRAKAPAWTDDFDALLPTAVPELLLDQIEEQARALEAVGQSKS